MVNHDRELLARYEGLTRALKASVDELERVRLIGVFVAEENQRWEQSEMAFLRARDAAGGEKLVSRVQQAPLIGETPMSSGMRNVKGTEDESPASAVNAMDLKRWMTVSFLGFLAFVFGAVAVLGTRFGYSQGVLVLVAALCAASAVAAVLVAAQWLRRFDVPLEDQVDADLAWMLRPRRHSHMSAELGRHIDPNRDFGEFPRRRPDTSDTVSALNSGADAPQRVPSHISLLKRALAMHSIIYSVPHLQMSDDFMRDALSSALSPRGSVDAAFESGYLALLSVLAEDERRAHEHPSQKVMQIVGSRFGFDVSLGLRLLESRYSVDECSSLAEALAWAEDIRKRVRALARK